MKVRLENLQPWKEYYVQVRGVGDSPTEWSQTYLLKTERDRVAPPPLSNLQLSSEQSAVSGTEFYWYGKDIIVTWDGYTAQDISNSPTAIWDFKNYAVRFETHDGVTKTFFTTDKKFILTNALNRSSFSGYGKASFKTIYVYGVDSTNNPSNEDGPWADGPVWSATSIETSYNNIVNPEPDDIENVSVDFRSPNAIVSWTLPSGAINTDAEYIELTIKDTYASSTTFGTSKTIRIPYQNTSYSVDYAFNSSSFNSGVGSPNLLITVKVIDIFNQQSAGVEVPAINEVPPAPTGLLVKPTETPGEYTWSYDDIAGTILDYKTTFIWEKIVSDSGDDGVNGLTGYTKIGASGNSYLAITSPNARRWVKLQHVDVFNQVSVATHPSEDYPVQPLSTFIADAVAPNPPTQVTASEVIQGSISSPGVVKISWKSQSDNDLINHKVMFARVTDSNSYNAWQAQEIAAKRTYISSITNSTFTVDTSYSKNSFQVGDTVTIINLLSGTTPTSVKTTIQSIVDSVVTVETNSLSGLSVTGSPNDNSATAAILSSCVLDLMPGTRYKFKLASSDASQTGQSTAEVYVTTTGSPLVAKKPLEVGTWFDSVKIVNYSIDADGLTVTLKLENPPSESISSGNGLKTGYYASIIDSDPSINGRYKITSTNVANSTITFSLTNSATPIGTTPINGTVTAGMFAIGANVIPGTNGIFLNENNYWSDIGDIKVGNSYASDSSSFRGLEWSNSNSRLRISGDIYARSGYFTGNVILNSGGALVAGDAVFNINSNAPYTSGYDPTTGKTYYIIPLEDSTLATVGNKISVSSSDLTLNDASIGGKIFYKTTASFDGQTVYYVYYWSNNGDPSTVFPGDAGSPFSLAPSPMPVTPSAGPTMNGKAYSGSVTSMDSARLISTDSSGAIKYLLSQSGTNLVGGFKIMYDRLESIVQGGLGVGMSASTALPSFWAGSQSSASNDVTNAVWRVDESGDMTLGNISFKGGTPTKIYSGVGNFANSDTPFYLSSTGEFSIQNFFRVNTDSAIFYVPRGGTNYGSVRITNSATSIPTPQITTTTRSRQKYGGTDSINNYAFSLANSTNMPGVFIGNDATSTSNTTNLIIGSSGSDTATLLFPGADATRPFIHSFSGTNLRINTTNSANNASAYIDLTGNDILAAANSSVELTSGYGVMGVGNGYGYVKTVTAEYLSNYIKVKADGVNGSSQFYGLILESSDYLNILAPNKNISLSAGTQITSSAPQGVSMSSGYTYIDSNWNNNGSVRMVGLGARVEGALGTAINGGNPGAIYLENMPAGGAVNIGLNGTRLYINTSSRRFKEDIHYFTNNEVEEIKNDVLSLNPTYFKYKQQGGTFDPNMNDYAVGYIAEDLDAADINWLVQYEDNQAFAIHYPLISVGLVEIAKSQQQEINELKQTMLQLEQRLTQLEEGN